jgi:diacylglycerol kinase family enzyme
VNALFIYNPTAGQFSIERELARCIDNLVQSGWSADLLLTNGPRNATELASKGVAQGRQMVVAVGGDGTVSEVANGLVGSEVILGVIPAGTTNVWALQMNIPSLPPWHPRRMVDAVLADLEERGWHRPPGTPSWLSDAFKVLLNSEVRLADVGNVNQRNFLLMCGIGFDAVVTGNVERELKRRYGMLAYVASGLSKAVEFQSARMRVVVDGQEFEQEDALMIVAANARLYGGILNIAPRAYLDDGLLDVCMFMGEGLPTIVRHFGAVLAGRHYEEADVEYLQVESMKVFSDPEQPVHLDDEVCGETPVDLRVIPRSLRVLVPEKSRTNLFQQPRIGLLADML